LGDDHSGAPGQERRANNARIDGHNRIAAKVIAKAGMAIDGQHELMAAHQDLHSDDVQFTPEGCALQGRQVAATVLKVLAGAKSGR
jgi:hypothetical protein